LLSFEVELWDTAAGEAVIRVLVDSDEVRVENRKRSTARVRLCYMNQKADAGLIVVKE
jgi:vacuolar-type H+-ATPase subunit I/STV1